MGVIDDLAKGATSGVFQGVTSIIQVIAGAITGKTPLTADQQARLLEQAANLDAQAKAADAVLMGKQADINAEEAKSSDPFVSRWRPAVGWTCVAGLIYQFLIRTMLPWAVKCVAMVFVMFGKTIPSNVHMPDMPSLDMGTLLPLLLGMLGLGIMRTVEKVKGVA